MTSSTPTGHGGNLLLTDFTARSGNLGWFVLNDNVMGGQSEGRFELRGGRLIFAGRTNTNGGGFSSIRTDQVELDLRRSRGVRLRVKGDGRRYTWRLSTNAQYQGRALGYWAEFETKRNEWETISIPFERFVPRFRGTVLAGPELDRAKIRGLGLMIYDGRDGPFRIQLDSVSTYSSDPPFSLETLRWQKRVLVVTASTVDDAQLSAQMASLKSARFGSEERDIVEVTLIENGTSSVAGRVLTDREVSQLLTALGLPKGAFCVVLVGKDGSVKLRSAKAVPMKDVHALIDTMPMRRSEMGVP